MSDFMQGIFLGVGVVAALLAMSILYAATNVRYFDERLQQGMFEWKGTIYKVEKVK